MARADLLDLTAELVDIASVSHHETALADHIEGELARLPWLVVDRLGDEVVARTDLGRASRLILAGHTDTVPANANAKARIVGDVLYGLGASDMKSGLAVFIDLARSFPEPDIDVTYVFYTGEEVDARYSGLGRLFSERPEWLAGDAAVLGEPTFGAVEAGCQGSLRLEVTLAGRRAHTARPWKGVNAVHRLAPVLDRLAAYEPRRPVLDGCEFAEALQAVGVEGGVANNVVPDSVRLVVNHRVAPDRDLAEAEAWARDYLAPALGPDDTIEMVEGAPGAAPGLDHPVLAALVERSGLAVRAKLGWTDVARFAARRIPAINLGPGDPELAHHPDERVERSALEATRAALASVLSA